MFPSFSLECSIPGFQLLRPCSYDLILISTLRKTLRYWDLAVALIKAANEKIERLMAIRF